MQTIEQGYRGLSILVWMNADRVFVLGTVVAGLLAGAYISASLFQI